MKTIMYFLVYIILCSICLAGTIDPNIADKHYISYGSKFKCIVSVCGQEESGKQYCASGVAIKPHWILTAAHVIKQAKTCNIKIESIKKIEALTLIPHQDFDSNNFGYYDIGLIYCNEDLSLDFYPELYDKENEVDQICSMSGYGVTGNFRTGVIISDNIRRAGSNTINYIDRQLLICNLTDKPTSMEFLIASGDSGGGLFINKKLAGINSCVMSTGKPVNSSYGCESGHTRVSQHISWINKEINNYEKK